jgi:copper chaperone
MYELKVEGMTCGGCAKSVTNSVKKIDADASVEVDLNTKLVKVNRSKSQDAISPSIINAGFTVVSAKSI